MSKETKINLNFDKYDVVNLNDVDFGAQKGENENSTSDARISYRENLINSEGNTPNVTPKKFATRKEHLETEKSIPKEYEKVTEDIGRDEVDHELKEVLFLCKNYSKPSIN